MQIMKKWRIVAVAVLCLCIVGTGFRWPWEDPEPETTEEVRTTEAETLETEEESSEETTVKPSPEETSAEDRTEEESTEEAGTEEQSTEEEETEAEQPEPWALAYLERIGQMDFDSLPDWMRKTGCICLSDLTGDDVPELFCVVCQDEGWLTFRAYTWQRESVTDILSFDREESDFDGEDAEEAVKEGFLLVMNAILTEYGTGNEELPEDIRLFTPEKAEQELLHPEKVYEGVYTEVADAEQAAKYAQELNDCGDEADPAKVQSNISFADVNDDGRAEMIYVTAGTDSAMLRIVSDADGSGSVSEIYKHEYTPEAEEEEKSVFCLTENGLLLYRETGETVTFTTFTYNSRRQVLKTDNVIGILLEEGQPTGYFLNNEFFSDEEYGSRLAETEKSFKGVFYQPGSYEESGLRPLFIESPAKNMSYEEAMEYLEKAQQEQEEETSEEETGEEESSEEETETGEEETSEAETETEEESTEEEITEEETTEEPTTEHVHSWEEASRTEPGCETAGKIVYKCSADGQTRTETIPAAGHDWKLVSSGEQNTYRCTRCGEEKSEENPDWEPPTTAHVHSWEEASRTEPGCETAGKIVFKCSTDGQTRTETIPATGHDWKLVSTGEQNTYRCTRCGEEKSEDNPDWEPPTTAHVHSWEVSSRTEPGCETPGKIVYKCSADGQTRTEEIPAVGHDWVLTQSAQQNVYRCRRCSEEKSEPNPDWTEPTVATLPAFIDDIPVATVYQGGSSVENNPPVVPGSMPTIPASNAPMPTIPTPAAPTPTAPTPTAPTPTAPATPGGTTVPSLPQGRAVSTVNLISAPVNVNGLSQLVRVYNTPGGSVTTTNGRYYERFTRFIQDGGIINGALGTDDGCRYAVIGSTHYKLQNAGDTTNLYKENSLIHAFRREAGSTVEDAFLAGNMVYLVVNSRGAYSSLVYDLGSGSEYSVYRRFVTFTGNSEYYVENRQLCREDLNRLFQPGTSIVSNVGDAGVVVTDNYIYYVQADNPARLVGCARTSGSPYATFGISGAGNTQFAMNNNSVYVLDNNSLYRLREGDYSMITICSFAVDSSCTIELVDVTKDFVFVELKGNVSLGSAVYRSVAVSVNLNDGTLYLIGLTQ